MICAKFGSSIWKKARIFIWINLNPFYPMILRHAKFGWNRPGSGEEDKNLNTNRWWTMNIRPSEKFSSIKNSKKDVDMVPNLWILKHFKALWTYPYMIISIHPDKHIQQQRMPGLLQWGSCSPSRCVASTEVCHSPGHYQTSSFCRAF